jgi:hypothetical protein
MMMKKNKLSLRRETIRTLEVKHLANAQGGNRSATTFGPSPGDSYASCPCTNSQQCPTSIG